MNQLQQKDEKAFLQNRSAIRIKIFALPQQYGKSKELGLGKAKRECCSLCLILSFWRYILQF